MTKVAKDTKNGHILQEHTSSRLRLSFQTFSRQIKDLML